MRLVTAVTLTALVMLGPTCAVAAEPPPRPEPTAEHAVLGTWVGSWQGSGNVKANPFGPGGTASWTDECTWFDDAGFHVVCRSEGTGPTGPMSGLGIMGFNPVRRVYTHYGIDNNGWGSYSEGTRSGDTWTFHSEESMGDVTYHSRFTIAMESEDRMAFTWAMSEDGETWTTLMTGASERLD